MKRQVATDRDLAATGADQADEVHASDTRADFERRIYRRSTDTTDADRLYEERLLDIAAQQHVAEVNFALPMPGVARIRLSLALPPRPTVNNKENQP